MCGVTGLWLTRGASADYLADCAARMADALEHRGPDDRGVWVDAGAGLALGFRRLSILELSAAGHQPMLSIDGRYALVFNGEIYNHDVLRRELQEKGARFRGSSDTEVLLEAIAAWGTVQALGRAEGMFAFAVWDRQQRELVIARDRMGKKPLYYTLSSKGILFASELKALVACPEFSSQSRSRRAHRVHALRVRARASEHLPRCPETGARDVPACSGRCGSCSPGLLACRRRRRGRGQ